MSRTGERRAPVLGAVAVVVLAGGAVAARQQGGVEPIKLLEHTTAIAYQKAHRDADLQAWHRRVPATEMVRIPSSLDGNKQRAVWYASASDRAKPLLVVLHSWSADYEQNLDIPFAEFAIANDWAFIHPDFRGPNRRPQATASDLAVQDVLDAVAFARQRTPIDPSRIYLVGYSGGAMKALILAGRQPELWAGVAAWSAIHDIADWYRDISGWHRRDHQEKVAYRRQISASCGGPPRPGSAAEEECRERSPLSYLGRAAGRVPILIAHGLDDRTVPLRHAIEAYDALADGDDRFTDAQRTFIDSQGQLPTELRPTRPLDSDLAPIFARANAPLRFQRSSRAVTLVLYDGGHDMVYNAALHWLNQQRRP